MFEAGSDYIKIIDDYVTTWTKKYIFYTKKVESIADEDR